MAALTSVVKTQSFEVIVNVNSVQLYKVFLVKRQFGLKMFGK